ncbi:MAG: aldo/keto reductase [Xanthobacteraceae bacterium]
MRIRSFGPHAEPLSVLGLGCGRIGSFSNPAPLTQIQRTLERALDLGITVFDTADVYGQGDSERVLGRFLKSRRDRAFVISKVGKRLSTEMRMMRPLKPVLRALAMASRRPNKTVILRRWGHMRSDFSIAHIAVALDATLRRLGLDTLDGLLLHSPPASALELAVDAALAEFKRAGKVRHYGVSCDDLACLKAALDLPGITLLQLPLDVIISAEAAGLTPSIGERSIAVFAREVIRTQPDLSPPTAIAKAAARSDVTCVIAGTSNAHHLEDLAGAIG